jgi:hypothetical protein
MFTLKPISREGIPEALEKAERYRLLNEPRLAESICLDILEIDPGNHDAIIMMLLSITDQFGSSSVGIHQTRELLMHLDNPYEHHYYSGIVCERQGKAILDRMTPGAQFSAYEWLSEAMGHYERAEAIRPTGNDDSILRWNTCARMIMRQHLQPRNEESIEHQLE